MKPHYVLHTDGNGWWWITTQNGNVFTYRFPSAAIAIRKCKARDARLAWLMCTGV